MVRFLRRRIRRHAGTRSFVDKEPERTKLSVALQMLKQNVARRLREPEGGPLWQPRYYDFNVWS